MDALRLGVTPDCRGHCLQGQLAGQKVKHSLCSFSCKTSKYQVRTPPNVIFARSPAASSTVGSDAEFGRMQKGDAVDGSRWPVRAATLEASTLEVDRVAEADMRENGYRSTRRTKLVCTIGPSTCSSEQLKGLAMGGMNVARLNMCHGTREWHRDVIRKIRKLNDEKGYSVAVMIDTEGTEIHMGDLGGASSAKAEVFSFFQQTPLQLYTFVLRAQSYEHRTH